jgi:hypothetical protein
LYALLIPGSGCERPHGHRQRAINHLEPLLVTCHEARMTKGKYSQAGGSILAISIIAGTVAGVIVRQPSIGFLVGTGAGVLLALLFWLNDRRR